MIIKNNLYDIFDVIVTSEDCIKKKPNPFSYTLTAQLLKVNPENCVVIEDSEMGPQTVPLLHSLREQFEVELPARKLRKSMHCHDFVMF